MQLTDTMQRYIVHWGEMGSRWGMNRSVAQIHALLYLAEKPLNADEIGETLGIARSNVSTGLKELAELGAGADHARARRPARLLHRPARHLGSHPRDHGRPQAARARSRRSPRCANARRCCKNDRDTPAAVRERIVTQLEFLETVTRWYDSVKRLPRKTLLKMMRMGERIAKVIGE